MKLINPYSYKLKIIGHRKIDDIYKEYPHLKNPVLNYKGIQVYKNFESHFFFVKDGIIITERTGWKERGKEVIDRIILELNGEITTFENYKGIYQLGKDIQSGNLTY